ncbi:hypothetical protein [Paracoccus aerius]|uniref:hypothetical protein n=1 Tax=Paracoccus aerius TaxID=1915382 RepID=UPI0017482772|nr:hypothetical protein [Paracoccus aerius]GHG38157.1 hypothetical protein GCM10017322_40820 [Paracoccus aerius]
MTKMILKDRINELLKQIDAASPREGELAMQQLRQAIAAGDRLPPQLETLLEETDPFDNVPV